MTSTAADELPMTHTSPTALELYAIRERQRGSYNTDAEYDYENFVQARADRQFLLNHIAALEAENELVRRCYSGLKAFALDVSRDPLNHWSGAAQRLLDTGVYDRAEKAEAQLATRLPDRCVLAQEVCRAMKKNPFERDGYGDPSVPGGFREFEAWEEFIDVADAILALLSGAATAEQRQGVHEVCDKCGFDLRKATTECPSWHGLDLPCDLASGAATPAPTAALTAQDVDDLFSKSASIGEFLIDLKSRLTGEPSA